MTLLFNHKYTYVAACIAISRACFDDSECENNRGTGANTKNKILFQWTRNIALIAIINFNGKIRSLRTFVFIEIAAVWLTIADSYPPIDALRYSTLCIASYTPASLSFRNLRCSFVFICQMVGKSTLRDVVTDCRKDGLASHGIQPSRGRYDET